MLTKIKFWQICNCTRNSANSSKRLQINLSMRSSWITIKKEKSYLWEWNYLLNSLALRDVVVTSNHNFRTHIKDRYLEHFGWKCFQVNATRIHWRLVNTCQVAVYVLVYACGGFWPQSNAIKNLNLNPVMAWCHQTTSHYPSQFWPRSLLPYGIIRPQSFKMELPAMLTSAIKSLVWERAVLATFLNSSCFSP